MIKKYILSLLLYAGIIYSMRPDQQYNQDMHSLSKMAAEQLACIEKKHFEQKKFFFGDEGSLLEHNNNLDRLSQLIEKYSKEIAEISNKTFKKALENGLLKIDIEMGNYKQALQVVRSANNEVKMVQNPFVVREELIRIDSISYYIKRMQYLNDLKSHLQMQLHELTLKINRN